MFIMDFETTGVNVFHTGETRDIPIEIGLIVTDPKLNILETYESFITPKSNYFNQDDWIGDQIYAYNVHKINYTDWINRSIGYQVCRDELIKLADKYTTINPNRLKQVKPIIISDNAVFETACIRQIFGDDYDYRDFFHYSTWDSNILLENTVGDPIPVHRALRDCGVLHRNLVRAFDRLNWL